MVNLTLPLQWVLRDGRAHEKGGVEGKPRSRRMNANNSINTKEQVWLLLEKSRIDERAVMISAEMTISIQ